MSLYGVMDGHGEFGHFVAAFVQEKLPQNIVAQEDLKTKAPKAITAAVKRTCEQLATTSINVAFSGTTSVFGVRVEDKLFVANIGDSRCVLCRQTEGDHYQAIPLSFDQKPENPKEKARILKAGGRVEPLPGPPGEDCGPPRVWLAEVDVPGLAMSRSIGDEVSQTVGVISIPEIVEHDLKPNDIFAVWASDGVWEFLSNEQACEIIWKLKPNYKAAAAELVAQASKRWKQEEEVVDDITCVIVAFNAAV
jgi:serine/threonine protein phosphatase PrpC